ncbi:glucoamylase family protein [Roseivirga sp. UBA838]|uniref:glucoamylase family protein n=2 Tax=unclassified Roseivirga TaxID=2626142 RepID=UPI002579CEBE|nr:glucoamylase family protein [Roseivirga sp. UBA838]|tara:strand:- start:18833 stop:20785 length:1953 start_codon:yes stop_codon:yes gene_type:complete
MKLHYLLSLVFLSMLACSKDEPGAEPLVLKNAFAGDLELSTGSVTEGVPVDRTISLVFSAALDESTTQSGILLSENDNEVSKTISLSSQGKSALLLVNGTLKDNTLYTISINQNLKSTAGASTTPTTIQFKTLAGALSLISIEIDGETVGNNPRVQDIGVQPTITFNFSTGVSLQSFQKAFRLTGRSVSISSSDENRVVSVTPTTALDYIKKYKITLSEELKSSEGRDFEGYSLEFYTQLNPTNKFPQISESELLTKVQEQTFKYFWDFAHPTSGLARERNSSGNTVTIGGSGFGVMAILVGIERGFISRQQGIDRLQTIVSFLKNADRFHGVWPHWMNGNTGKAIPFSATDDGGDLVETAFMIQGLLTVREYLNASNTQEKAIIDTITELWEEVEWDWYTRGGQNVLYWHWSPNVGWEKNLKIQGWNESLIVYVLAASSPTHPISANVYHEGWARNGNMANGEEYFGTTLPLGYSYGGPLFFSHYSFLGLDPRQLEDQYANYWDQNVAHSKINYAYAVANPKNFVGYNENAWGLTASDNHQGYSAHSPTNDLGVITPTAALSSFPYTPDESMKALKHFYYIMGDMLWGEYGFYDAFNLTESWVASSYLAIDQGPIVLMIENHRTGLLWNLFMKSSEITNGLKKLGFTSY